jgi:predicted anti-sigma-YlaC factor YlaD
MTPLSCATTRPLLSAYLDGDLDRAAAAAVAAHIDGCAECQGMLADLRKLAEAARGLGPVAPPAHSWQAIARRTRVEDDLLATRASNPRRSPTWQWLGLAAAILAVTTVAYVLGPSRSLRAPGPATAVNAPSGPSGESAGLTDELNAAVTHYERAIAVLQAAAATGTSGIEPAVAAALAADGSALDKAIAESRAALAESPDSESARVSLFEALRRKIAMLQATVTLINEMNQGDPAGAARAADGLGRQS